MPQPHRSDAVKNRELLLQAARDLFAQQGVDAVSMSAVAEAAGVGKGTLYRNFDNKAQLCHALLDEEMRALQERVLLRLRQQGDPRADLAWFVEQVARFAVSNTDLLMTDPSLMLAHPAHLWWRQTIRGLLLRADCAGDVDYFADTLYILLDVQTIRFQRRVLGYDAERIITGLHALLARIAP
jgi:AcrR family transcriptional regulator